MCKKHCTDGHSFSTVWSPRAIVYECTTRGQMVKRIKKRGFRRPLGTAFSTTYGFGRNKCERERERETLLLLDVWTLLFQFFSSFAHVLCTHTLFSVDFTQLRMNVHLCSVFCTQKLITERNFHLAGEMIFFIICNCYQTKTNALIIMTIMSKNRKKSKLSKNI